MDLLDEALQRFAGIIEQAQVQAPQMPIAMTVATVGEDGSPSARVLLLKEYNRDGFVFYTNTGSRKGRELARTPQAALVFLFQPLLQQVQVEGRVEPVTAAEADAYWLSRPRESQIGAWASRQSERLEDRQHLLARVAEFEQKYAGQDVPRPPHWSGYRVIPSMIEFWRGHEARLNERDHYTLEDGLWRKVALYP